MKFTLFKKLLLSALIFVILLQHTVFSDYAERITDTSVSITEQMSSIFLKERKETGPIGLEINNSILKNICIGFNSGLHNLSKIDRLPIIFENPKEVAVPVLLYHHIIEDEGYGDNVMSLDMFEKHLKAIKNAGYNTVSAKEMIDFVYYGSDLPENPILISFDDGYLSNYELAYPLLKKYNMKAIIFAIGWAIGMDTYKDTATDIIPHFGFSHIMEMTASGLIEVQSHTYDMHQSPSLETTDSPRESALQLPSESDDEYIAFLENDYNKFDKLLFNNAGYRNYAIAYPHGEYSDISEEVFKKAGAYITFTTEYANPNILIQGNLDSLRTLNRFTISESISPSQLISLIDSVYNKKQEN